MATKIVQLQESPLAQQEAEIERQAKDGWKLVAVGLVAIDRGEVHILTRLYLQKETP